MPVEDVNQSPNHRVAQRVRDLIHRLHSRVANEETLQQVDLLLEEEAEERCQHVIDALGWEGPVYQISAFQKMNLDPLCNDIMDFIETLPAELEEEEEKKEVEFKWDTYHKNTLEAHDEFEDDLDDDDWDEHPNTFYTKE